MKIADINKYLQVDLLMYFRVRIYSRMLRPDFYMYWYMYRSKIHFEVSGYCYYYWCDPTYIFIRLSTNLIYWASSGFFRVLQSTSIGTCKYIW